MTGAPGGRGAPPTVGGGGEPGRTGRGIAGGGEAGATGAVDGSSLTNVVARETGAAGAAGSETGAVLTRETGAVEGRAAGGGRGALGSWMEAVALLGTAAGALPAGSGGVSETGAVAAVITGAVADWAVGCFCVRPAPGRARRVMRTVSFLRGTEPVLVPGGGKGTGWVLVESLMAKIRRRDSWNPQFCQD